MDLLQRTVTYCGNTTEEKPQRTKVLTGISEMCFKKKNLILTTRMLMCIEPWCRQIQGEKSSECQAKQPPAAGLLQQRFSLGEQSLLSAFFFLNLSAYFNKNSWDSHRLQTLTFLHKVIIADCSVTMHWRERRISVRWSHMNNLSKRI